MKGVWDRLKVQLQAAMKSKTAAGAKVDPKKTVQAIQQFMTQFAPVMAELESAFKLKTQADAAFAKAAEKGMKLVTPMLQQVQTAHKAGFNADSSLEENMEGRLGEMFDRLKELKQYGSEVQWG
ncbi:MAG TPA: hypothetical protein VMB03_20470 [Bryobacteraceae bacterium]|nr:hypothetical protein [Bryobacteraceae bacterium]